MALGWIILALLYLITLFWIARWGDMGSLWAKKITSHPAIYSLAIAIYCTAWTFFGSVGEASRNTWSYLPILLGPMLLYLVGYRFILKLALVSKKQHITTIADFIASRYGKRQSVALVVTIIALLAIVPYIALQLKAIGAAFSLVSTQQQSGIIILIATVFIAVFSIYFGTKRTDVTEYRRGLMLAIAFESILKLLALLIVALVSYMWWQRENGGSIFHSFTQTKVVTGIFSFSFFAQTLMAAGAVICLPRQFHVAIIDNLSLSHIKTARWLFPLYLALIALVIPIIAVVGESLLAEQGIEPDTYVLHLAIFSDNILIEILVFLGGLSAATAMIIVATLTLSTMITNDVILPKILAKHRQDEKLSSYTRTILSIRRVVIGILLALAYLYHQQMTDSRSLASIGLIAFSLVIQLMPAIFGGLYWKKGHAQGVYAGLICGVVAWILWLLMPLQGEGLDLQIDAISYGAMLSLSINTLAYIIFSLTAPVRLIDRIQAQAFVAPKETKTNQHKKPYSTTVGDLITLLNTFLGENRCQYLVEKYQCNEKITLVDSSSPPDEFLVFCERALGGVIGASSAKALIDSALSGKKLDFEEVVNFFDDTTQAIQFNMSVLLTSIESIEQGISVIDKNLNLVAWNKRYLDIFNYPEELVSVGNSIEKLVRYNAERGECGVGDVNALVNKRIEHLRNGTAHRFIRQRSDGRMIEMVGNPLPGGGFVTSFNDITEHIEIQKALKEANIDLENRIQKSTEQVQAINAELRKENSRRAEAEKELIRARKAAEEANASKTRFLALASHDILQPLNAAKLYLSVLDEMNLSSDADNIVQKLNDSVLSSEVLIATLLDIARLDQGELKPQKESFPLSDVLLPLIGEFSINAKKKDLELRVRTQDLWVNSDRTYLYRIIQNLLSNAIKYTESGKILLTLKRQSNRALLQVRDTGIGIAEDEQKKIFGDFYRVDDSHQHGVGLGLGVVARLSKQLDTPVQVSSTSGLGSCFSIALPLSDAKIEDGESKAGSKALLNFANMKILCVDDQQENLDALNALLIKWQAQVMQATHRSDAMQCIAVQKPDMLMIDYHLGNSANGLELIQEIREYLAENIPAILLTANREDSIVKQCQVLDVNYLSKPIKPAKLRSLLQASYQSHNII
ncbi:PAS domain-containing hybrid sensor histidine kinase/response regulator [Agarilytica rhodophyticola]|uniref:PAS domain-containing hybrid sensor histidine kinase/response regulator n=1 Tax=Agarilytica rhodophyticola TaxID=1737490 RepID=UPI000B34793C|nr:PAS domain-containing hybrid sensor histidine kinase/response regulator [Agarilytica rhodophyticola]